MSRAKGRSESRCLLLSLHPRHACNIFAGIKTIELRRIRPKLSAGDMIVVYTSSPIKAISGWCTARSVLEGPPEAIWRQTRHACAISKTEFDEYFRGAARSFAINLTNPTRLSRSVSLETLRLAFPGFSPPQSYHYISDERMLSFLVGPSAVAA